MAGQSISGNNASRIFGTDQDLTLENLTLTEGVSTTGGTRFRCDLGYGGAVCALGTLSLTNCAVLGNATLGTSELGGALFVEGSDLTLTNSTLSGNSTLGTNAYGGGAAVNIGSIIVNNSDISGNSTADNGSDGGALWGFNGTITLNNSMMTGNSTGGDFAEGGAVYASSSNIIVNNSTISSNSTSGGFSSGGGLYASSGDISLTNSTVSGNSSTGGAAFGGGMFVFTGNASLTNTTFTLNSSLSGAGGVGMSPSGGSLNLHSAILAGNTGPEGNFSPGDLSQTITVNSNFSLFGDAMAEVTGTNANNVFNDAPGLIALLDNGCSTPAGSVGLAVCVMTHAPNAGSVTLDAGDNPLGLSTDQRGAGFPRISGSQTDIGAYEGLAPAIDLTPDPISFGDVLVGASSANLSVTLSNPGSAPLNVTAVTAAVAPFAASGGTCGSVPFAVPISGSCTVSYTFSPTANGASAQTITVSSDAPGGSDNQIELQGTGVQAAIDLSPDPISFGDVLVGASSANLSVTLSNPGSAPLNVTAVTAAVAPFAASGGTCGAAPFAVPVSGSCTVSYTFSPSVTGPATQTITVSSDAIKNGTGPLSASWFGLQ